MIDVTELKHFMHKADLDRKNPALFKRIGDIARNSDFKEKWTLEQMMAFFLNSISSNN